MDESAKLSRLLQLQPWIRGLGACYACSLTFALAQTEKEAGEVFPVPPPINCARADMRCREKAKARWREMPKPELEETP